MSSISTSLSGAGAAQAALLATQQNLANMQTRGYTRQGVRMTAIGPTMGTNSAGNGVDFGSLLRFSDSYKNNQLWRSNSEFGQREAPQQYLSQLERVMGDDTSGLSNGVDKFFQALNAAAVDPTSSPLRQAVITASNAMAQQFNSIYSVTSGQMLSVSEQRAAMLPGINALTANVANLNGRITAAVASGTNPSALIDERDLAIDDLSAMLGVEVSNNADGSVNLSMRSGQPLVANTAAAVMTIDNSGATEVLKLTMSNTTFTVESAVAGGQLGGLSNFQTNVLAPLQKSIAEMAEQLSTLINDQLAGGYDLNGAAGKPLFTFNANSSTGMLQIDPTIKAADLAFSNDPAAPGDSSNLQLIINVKNASVSLTSIGTVLLGDADTQLVGKLGIDSQQNQALLKTAKTIRFQAEDDWKSTSGVNIDEEAANLIEFEKMYQANMKAIAVANSLFDATLAMMG